jgi:hypothetical protein
VVDDIVTPDVPTKLINIPILSGLGCFVFMPPMEVFASVSIVASALSTLEISVVIFKITLIEESCHPERQSRKHWRASSL